MFNMLSYKYAYFVDWSLLDTLILVSCRNIEIKVTGPKLNHRKDIICMGRRIKELVACGNSGLIENNFDSDSESVTVIIIRVLENCKLLMLC
jgi:hypothetical protein